MNDFHEKNVDVDNPQSREEDEELEEQRRRQEELADLLAAGIQEFNYDESTMNSSATSADCGANEPNYSVKIKNALIYDNSEKTSFNNYNIPTNLSDTVEQSYKNANQNEQLKVLYDVRVREVNNVRNEFSQYKTEISKEITILKNKLTLSEAEIRHLQVTLSNSESLLVEKSEIIRNLKEAIKLKDQEVEKLKKTMEQQNFEICTYQSTVNELQLKLADNNPFSLGSRKLNSEEMQKAHQEQIVKLETLLQEQTQKVKILEKERSRLDEDVKKLLREKNKNKEDNNLTIMGLSKKLQSTQEQCKDLFLLGEAIKKESDHFKERLEQLETNKIDASTDVSSKKLDKETTIVHLEKLKRMLLDKDIQLNTLKAKLKFYDSDLAELFEYRQLLNNMFSFEIKPCSNLEHEELIIFMRGQLQSYQQAVEDRNNQIINLNSVNKELQEKIEEMIQQTRTEIQNIAQKYSLPQLETMSNELKNAQETINDLKRQLLNKEENEKTISSKNLEKMRQENNILQEKYAKEKNNREKILEELKKVNQENQKLVTQIEDFKKTDSLLNEENKKIKTQIQKICLKLGLSEADIFESDSDIHEINTLKSKYGSLHEQLQQVVTHLENMSPRKSNVNIILKLRKQVENYLNVLNTQKIEQKEFEEKLEQWNNLLSDFIESFKYGDSVSKTDMKEAELKDSIEDLTNAKTMLEGEKFALEYQIKSRSLELDAAKQEIRDLIETKNHLIRDSENDKSTIQKLTTEIDSLKKHLKIGEENNQKLEHLLEDTQKQLNNAKEEILNLLKTASVTTENNMKKNLFRELQNIENVLENEKSNMDTSSSDVFQKCLKAQVLKIELALRERLQEENLEKMRKIEELYKKVLNEKNDLYNKEKEKWKHEEANYRQQFAAVLEECGKKMQQLENENHMLLKQIKALSQEYNTFKNNATSNLEKYNKVAVNSKKTVEDLNRKWSTILEHYMFTAAKIQKQHQKSSKNIIKKIALNQTELNLIQSMYEEKIRKLKQERMERFSQGKQESN